MLPVMITTETRKQPNLFRYEELSGPAFASRIGPKDVIFIPISAPENHGEHLPLGTDLYISEEVSLRAAIRYAKKHPEDNIFLYPCITIGGATIRGRGSVKIRSSQLRKALLFLGKRLIKQGFLRILFISGHGGVPHVHAMDHAAAALTRIIHRKDPDGACFAPAALFAGKAFAGDYIDIWKQRGISLPSNVEELLSKDLHGGWMETSMMLAIRPDLCGDRYLQMPTIEPKQRWWLNRITGVLKWFVRRLPLIPRKKEDLQFGLELGKNDLSWIMQGREEGYLGDPKQSTPEFGNAVLDAVCDDIADAMRAVFLRGLPPKALRSGGYAFWQLVMILRAAAVIGAVAFLVFIGYTY